LRIVKSDIELQGVISDLSESRSKIGFVPTMGALHEGHLQLVKQSHEENDLTIVSIFVNPKQFNNKEDFDKYPVTIERDKQMLERAYCDILFLPDETVVYPKNFKPAKLNLGQLDSVFEGPLRPGHFDGVVQVVYRLFEMVRPHTAYFGLKDYQQCMVIKLLRNAYFPKIELKFAETIRQPDGLAMSSRNARLSQIGLEKASNLYKALTMVKNLKKHIEPFDALKYAKYNLAQQGIEVEYLSLANADTLIESKKWLRKGKNVVLAAVWVEGVRLIDNIIF